MSPTPTPAEQVQRRYHGRVTELRQRRDLSDDGRRRQMAKAKQAADKEMSQIRQQEVTDRDAREQELTRRLFGGTARDAASATSRRDAEDRAQRLSRPQDALDLLGRARMSGDVQLAKAVAQHALGRVKALPAATAWAGVLDEWSVDEAPSVDEALTELGELHRARSGPARFAGAVSYTLPPPAELGGHSIEQLARAADHGPDETEAPDPAARLFGGR